MDLSRRSLLLGSASLLVAARDAQARDFAAVREHARGQTVYFYAWGGSPQINDYIGWAGAELRARFGVGLVQVKLTDTAEAVSRVLAEKEAGRGSGGAVDLVWINGQNFAAMKEKGLLFGPFARDLPNFSLVDTVGKPTTLVDFTIPTEGYESPWGMAQFVLLYDQERVPEPPRSAESLLAWCRAHPGRFAYPAPPDFVGVTFLKQILYETIADPARLEKPVTEAAIGQQSARLFAWLEALNPHLWRAGRTYPSSYEAQHQLLADGELDFSMSFNPAEASSLILAGRLPKSVRTAIFAKGSIGNTHFVAIPFNAAHKEGAMVVADFLLSPEAQARKEDPRFWGDPTVLDVEKLTAAERRLFAGLDLGPATLPPEKLVPVLPEPHPSWMVLLQKAWRVRFAS